MKIKILFGMLFVFCFTVNVFAQTKTAKKTPAPTAKQLNDSIISINKILDTAKIKIDSLSKTIETKDTAISKLTAETVIFKGLQRVLKMIWAAKNFDPFSFVTATIRSFVSNALDSGLKRTSWLIHERVGTERENPIPLDFCLFERRGEDDGPTLCVDTFCDTKTFFRLITKQCLKQNNDVLVRMLVVVPENDMVAWSFFAFFPPASSWFDGNLVGRIIKRHFRHGLE